MVHVVAVTGADTSEQARNDRRKTPRGKTGRVSTAELDKTDLRRALSEIAEALKQIDRLNSPEHADLTRADRAVMLGDALAHAQLGGRFVDGVLARNDYTLVGV